MVDLQRGSPSSQSTGDFYPAYRDPNRDLPFILSSESSSTIRLSFEDDDSEHEDAAHNEGERISINNSNEYHEPANTCISEASHSNTDKQRVTVVGMNNDDVSPQNIFITNDIMEGTNPHLMTSNGDDRISPYRPHSSRDKKKRWLKWKELSRKIKGTLSKKKRDPEDARATKWEAMKTWLQNKNVFPRQSRR